MGKKKKDSSSLGRALIKDRFSGRRLGADSSLLHTADIADGYDWGRLNLQSVTEENSFQDFLSTAELAGTEFQAEKLNITFVNPVSHIGLLSDSEKKRITDVQERNKQFLQIPRRPNWDSDTTPEELHSCERDAFLDWRRKLALFQEENTSSGLILTPYEKNIEFWRQLWRVVEKSDVVVQIVDGRNPLLFRCEDLERYVQEVSVKQGRGKINFILINKADFLTEVQRKLWAEFFNKEKIHVAFFSAIQPYPVEIKEEVNSVNESVEIDSSDPESDSKVDIDNREMKNAMKAPINEPDDLKSLPKDLESLNLSESIGTAEETAEEGSAVVCDKKEMVEKDDGKNVDSMVGKTDNEKAKVASKSGDSENDIRNSFKVLTRRELIDLFKNLKVDGQNKSMENSVQTVGLVGYPNVGKSSTINCLMEVKKVSVSATPGKTKHFQTLFLDSDLLLCDCPGLVMPSFVSTQAEMVLWGILPVDRLRDHVPSVSLLATLIPRHLLEARYGIMLPRPAEGEDPDRPPTSEELLNAYGYIRGFMTQRGLPDNPRTARYVLKDFINGKLLYAKAPPGHSQEEFHTFDSTQKKNKVFHSTSSGTSQLPPQLRGIRGKVVAEELDNVFFNQSSAGVHTKGRKPVGIGGVLPGGSSEGSIGNPGKPWKRHNNKNKREKLRRVYAHLDQ